MKKSIALISIVMTLCMIVSSCTAVNRYNNKYVKIAPKADTVPDKGLASKFTATLYSVSGNSYTFAETVIETYNDVLPIEALISTVLSQRSMSDIAGSLSLSSVIISYDTCIVNLTGKFPDDISDWLTVESVLLLTLNDFCSCSYICMLHDSKMPSYNGFPLGTGKYYNYTPTEYVQSRLDDLSPAQASAFAPIDFIYYIPIAETDLLKTSVSKENLMLSSDSRLGTVRKLLSAYSAYFTKIYNRTYGTAYKSCFKCTMRTDSDMAALGMYSVNIKAAKEIHITDTELANAVSLTVICNIPNVNMIDIVFNGETLPCTFDDSTSSIGTDFHVYYPIRKDSTLEKKEVVLPAQSCYSPADILRCMLTEENTRNTLYPNYLKSRVKVEYWSDNTLVISMTKDAREEVVHNFIKNGSYYDSNETRESLFMYSIVNTMVQLPTIDRVYFVDADTGEPCESLLNIYLGMPLYENPGLNAD